MEEYISVALVISADENYNELISDRLRVSPTSVKDKCEIKISSFAHCEWIYDTGRLEVRSISEAVEPILNLFDDKRQVIKELLMEIDGKCDIVIVISANAADGPEVVLDSRLISFANEIHAEIGFDLYYYDKE